MCTNKLLPQGTYAPYERRELADTVEFTETVTHSDVLQVFRIIEGPAVTSTDVSEALDCSDETARRKLAGLHEQGIVGRRKTGRTVRWWLATDREVEATPVDPVDPIFADRPALTSDRKDLSESVDEISYGTDA